MKKIVALLICGTMMCSSLILPENTYAKETNDTHDENILEVKNDLSFVSDEELLYAEVLVMDNETYSMQEESVIQEVLDNGTDIIIETKQETDLAQNFQSLIQPEESGAVAGYYVRSNGEDYSVSVIEYALMVEENVELSEEEEKKVLEDIVVSEEIDANLVLADAEKLEGIDKLGQLEADDIAKLQVATDLGNSFADNDKFVYFYKYGSANGTGTDYAYSEYESKTNYVKLGSLNMLIYAIKIKTDGATTYDTIFATCTASGLSNKHVYQFNVSMSVDIDDDNHIVDFSSPESSEETMTTTITAGGGYSVSYTYNPDKLQRVKPACGERYVKTWECYAPTGTYYNNMSWTIKPSIILKKENGTSDIATLRLYVDYFRLGGGIRTYTMTQQVDCTLRIRNHYRVY